MELQALKPGNVHVHAAGHGMTTADFERSAAVSVEPLTATATTVGRRIRDAVAATRAAVGSNTAPAGLGTAPDQDVAATPSIDLRQAMVLASPRDNVARQYATDYADVFDIGVAGLARARRDGAPPDRATSLIYLDFLAAFPDSHVQRKHGAAAADRVRDEAVELRRVVGSGPRDHGMAALLAFDRRLKSAGLNPGSSADLAVASLLAAKCEDMLSPA